MMSLTPWQTRTQCCGHKFCVRDAKKNVSDFAQKHFVSETNVSQFARARKHHEQQCVRKNVSSFARAFREFKKTTATGTSLNKRFNEQAPVVERLNNAIHWIVIYPGRVVQSPIKLTQG